MCFFFELPSVSASQFEALVAPDVRFSLLFLGLLLKKGWSVSFGSEPRVFGPKVSRGRPRSELRVEGFQNCFWLVCSTGSTPQVTAVMPEISAPPSSSSVCPLLSFPMASSSDSEKEWRAPDKKEDQPSQSKGSGSETTGSEVRVEGSVATGSEKGAQVQGSRQQGQRQRVQGFRSSRSRLRNRRRRHRSQRKICGSDGGGGTHATEGRSKGQGFPGCEGHVKGSIGKQNVGKVKGKEPKAAAIGVGKADINMPTVKRQPKPPPTKAAPKGRGPAPSAPSAPSKPAGHVGAVPKRSRSVRRFT